MMIHIPIPEGLKLPENAETEPFTAEVEFLAMDGMLMPVSVAGVPIASEEPEMEEEGEYEEDSGEMEEGGEYEDEEGGEMCSECGGDEKKCRCGKMGKGGGGGEDSGGFMVAIERALAQPKR